MMTLSDSSSRTWLGYITAEVVHKCITLCADECLACTNHVRCPLLHFHNELSLKDKIQRYLARVVLDIEQLFDQFILQFGWFALNRQQYIQLAEIFLNVSTPEAILYGKYITHQNQGAIYGLPDIVAPPVPAYTSVETEPNSVATEKRSTKRKPQSTERQVKTKRCKKQTSIQEAVAGEIL
ncbi:MAG TPA: hypothetical protein DDY16_00445 [Tenacibaculum sp.]|nr:hypothetical protein [Tenacibaculum sp.]